MKITAQTLWIVMTTLLTLLILVIVYPLLAVKYGSPKAILLCGVLIGGMLLYYLRGVLVSRPKK